MLETRLSKESFYAMKLRTLTCALTRVRLTVGQEGGWICAWWASAGPLDDVACPIFEPSTGKRKGEVGHEVSDYSADCIEFEVRIP